MVRGMLSKWLRIAAAVSCSSDTPGSAGAGFGFGMMGQLGRAWVGAWCGAWRGAWHGVWGGAMWPGLVMLE